jgi:hemoglobin
MADDAKVPTLYEWIGGSEPLAKLTTRFYEHVAQDAILAPDFAHMGDEHPRHVATFLAEVLGGPAGYSADHGGHAHMLRRHLDRHLTE